MCLHLTIDKEECEKRLRFESLLVDISSRFVNLSSDEVDAGIEDALRQVCESLGLDLSALWQWEADSPEIFILTHLYRKRDEPLVPERMEAAEFHPWALEQVLANRVVVLSSVEDAPPEASRDKETWHHFGVKTTLTVPLSMGGGDPFGAVSFNDLEKERVWSESMVNRLKVVAQVFASALVRQRFEQALLESDERLKLALDVADAGTWIWSAEREEFWLTDRLAGFFGIAPGSALPFGPFLEMVHPDDRDNVVVAFQSAFESRELTQVEYRVVNPDEAERWVHARGRVCRTRDGCERLMGTSADITKRKEVELQLKESLEEVQHLRTRLKAENEYLRNHLQYKGGSGKLVGQSPAVQQMLSMAKRVAETDATVLITGETGTGKELLAQVIHDWSPRKASVMVQVNCAALPAQLIEGELFGREKGAYTGAMTQQVGRFEVADGSTLFLDEIGDLPLELQTKLLRILQDGCFERLGSNKTIHADVRVIAATNRNLAQMVQEGTFREDLFHRLNVFPIESPPLRERRDDIPELIWRFVQEFNNKMGRSVSSIPKSAMEELTQYAWPGNIRELRNLVERAMILCDGKKLGISIPASVCPSLNATSLEEVERRHILEVLEQTEWRIGGSGGAAEMLGLARTTLNARMKKLGISRD